ncbi:MAG: sensor histidine kinase [Bdellovibrionia bacterium]
MFELQPMFAAVFLYHAFVVRRMSRVEPFVPYAYIVPMSLAAASYYFCWQSVWLTTNAHWLRVIAHLCWISGATMVYFHIGALGAYFQPRFSWIPWVRKLVALLLLPAISSLVLLLLTGKTFFFSAEPMPTSPLAVPEGMRDRVQHAFSASGMMAAVGILFILIEVSSFSYFLYRLLKTRGDKWLMFGLTLTLLAILNDVIASMRLDSYAVPFLFVAIFVEIIRLTALTEKANRERLLRVQNSMRLAQIGEMTATVAHELVNPLFIIQGYLDVGMRSENLDQERVRKIFEKIQDSTSRMLAIVRGLRDHARQEATENERISIARALNEVAEMMRPIYVRERVELQLEIQPDLPHILGSRGKLQQVLLNLLQNASDATEGQAERKIRLSASQEESVVRIDVTDNGCGIPTEIASKVFTPFYTTKPHGKGTGIGLSFVDSQVRLMNGRVNFDSEPGRTVFTLRFPAAVR